MVLALIIVVIALIALYIYFWYITIPATIIIIVTIWLYNKRCNRKSSTKHSERTYYQQSTEDSNNQHYHQHEYEDPYDEDEFDAIINDDILEYIENVRHDFFVDLLVNNNMAFCITT